MEATVRAAWRACGWSRIEEATPDGLTAYLLAANPRTGKPLSASRQNNVISAVSSLLAVAVAERAIGHNWAETMQRPPNDRGAGSRALSPAELERLIAAARDHEEHGRGGRGTRRSHVYAVAAYTGLRLGELRALRVAHANLAAQPPMLELPPALTKAKRSQTVPIHAAILGTLAQAVKGKGPADAVFETMPTARTFAHDLDRAKIPRVDARGREMTFHGLRKTFVTMLARAGVGQRMAQELARHTDPRLTNQVYTDAAQLPLSEALGKIPILREVFHNPAKWLAGSLRTADDVSVEQPHRSNETEAMGSASPAARHIRDVEPVASGSRLAAKKGRSREPQTPNSHFRDLNPEAARGRVGLSLVARALLAAARAFEAAVRE